MPGPFQSFPPGPPGAVPPRRLRELPAAPWRHAGPIRVRRVALQDRFDPMAHLPPAAASLRAAADAWKRSGPVAGLVPGLPAPGAIPTPWPRAGKAFLRQADRA